MATANYGWVTPTVGGSSGVWGTLLNTVFDEIDSDLNDVSTTASAALARAGGTMTGEIVALTQVWTHSALGNVTTTQAFDLDTANSFSATVTGAVTFSFSNVPTNACYMTLELTAGGSYTVTWPSSIKWAGGSEPTLTDSATNPDILTFFTRDGGTTWYGALAIANAS